MKLFHQTPRLPNTLREEAWLDSPNLASKHRTSGGMTGRLGNTILGEYLVDGNFFGKHRREANLGGRSQEMQPVFLFFGHEVIPLIDFGKGGCPSSRQLPMENSEQKLTARLWKMLRLEDQLFLLKWSLLRWKNPAFFRVGSILPETNNVGRWDLLLGWPIFYVQTVSFTNEKSRIFPMQLLVGCAFSPSRSQVMSAADLAAHLRGRRGVLWQVCWWPFLGMVKRDPFKGSSGFPN